MPDRQAARVPFYCLTLLGAAFVLIAGHLGAESNRLAAQCAPIHGAAECQLKIFGR